MELQWEACPNPDVYTLHTDIRLPYVSDGRLGSPFERDKPQPPEDVAFVEALMTVDGVNRVSLAIGDVYSAQIIKGRVFAWGPIRRRISELFRERYEAVAVTTQPE